MFFGDWFQHFEESQCPHLNNQAVSEDLLDCLTLDGEGTTILQNIGNHSPNATVSHPRRLEILSNASVRSSNLTSFNLPSEPYTCWQSPSITFLIHLHATHLQKCAHDPPTYLAVSSINKPRRFCTKYKLVSHPSEKGACMACWFVKYNPVSSLYDHCAINFLLSNIGM